MILLVDVGNTRKKFKLSDMDAIFVVPTRDFNYSLPKEFIENTEDVIVSSVVPEINDLLANKIKEELNIEPIFINTSFKTLINYPKEVSNELGADIFSALEALAHISDTYLSIDCGTATTFNLINKHNYIGTAIAPGIKTSHNALWSKASQIFEVTLEGDYELLSQNTEKCVRSGTINGFSFMIDGFIDSIKEKYRLSDLDVFITGGVAKLIIPALKNKTKYIEDLIFKGLYELYLLNNRGGKR